ncbi:MAG: tetratricopeptide repeat protein [Phycisphaerales bacterium]|nr:tetratricopeptide repeat protein [Phycisphaerales bacterium]
MSDSTETNDPSSASPLAEVADLVRQGDAAAALSGLKERIRKEPGNADLRLSLAQLQAIMGDWDKAMAAADTASTLDTERGLLCQQWKLQIAAEQTRAEVFAGERTAIVMGEPEPWIAGMQDALRLDGEGQSQAADDARRAALENATARGGTINGTPFEWLCDADERIGPCFEAIINGRYAWVPQGAVTAVTVKQPSELIDLVWVETVMRFTNGGETAALTPVRYPGSTNSDDQRIVLGRLTTFEATAGGTNIGFGQRLLATDADDYPLLQIQSIEFNA